MSYGVSPKSDTKPEACPPFGDTSASLEQGCQDAVHMRDQKGGCFFSARRVTRVER